MEDIINYFIDKKIIIYKDDTNEIKFNKYILKYKKIISIIILIILLIVGYYCNPYKFNNIVNVKNIENIENALVGGSSLGEKISKSKFVQKSAASYDTKMAKVGEFKDSTKESLKSGAKAAISPSTYYNAGATAARSFTNNADLIYQILYSIALFIVICIITIPAIGFIIVGIFCYFLLKNKMKKLKSL